MPAAKPQPLADLKSWGRNPRRIRPERLQQLARSMAADPAMMDARPLVALPDGTVIMGNQRLAAARSLGWKRIPTVTVDLDEETAASWAFRDNQSYGEWEDELVAEMLSELEAGGADLDLTGFADREVGAYLDSLAAPANVDDAPPLPKGKPRSKPGEVYELGAHRLLCGDATDAGDALKLMGGEHARLVFTSPPYGDARAYDGTASGLEAEHLARFLPAFAGCADLLVVNLGLLWRDHAVVPYWDAYHRAAADAGLKLLAWNVWDREHAGSIGHATAMFPQHHEWIFVYGAKRASLNRTVRNKGAGEAAGLTRREQDGIVRPTTGPERIQSHRPLGSVLRVGMQKGANTGDHPAVFPVALPSEYITATSKRGDIVVDPFAGSGATMIAAHTLERRCFMVEISPGYCDVIRERYARFAEGAS